MITNQAQYDEALVRYMALMSEMDLLKQDTDEFRQQIAKMRELADSIDAYECRKLTELEKGAR